MSLINDEVTVIVETSSVNSRF